MNFFFFFKSSITPTEMKTNATFNKLDGNIAMVQHSYLFLSTSVDISLFANLQKWQLHTHLNGFRLPENSNGLYT